MVFAHTNSCKSSTNHMPLMIHNFFTVWGTKNNICWLKELLFLVLSLLSDGLSFQGLCVTFVSCRKPLCTGLSDDGSNKGGNGIKEKEVQPEMNQSKYYRSCEETDQQMNSLESRKARLFGELEEICRNASIAKANGGDASVENFATTTSATTACLAAANAIFAAAEASCGDDEAPPRMMDEKFKERKKMKDELSSMAIFFEGLVHQLMEHQENLHRKFMGAIERLDEERKAREQIWRQNELERLEQEAAVRANERALASQREASIVSYLEKITGQVIKLPPKTPTLELEQGISGGLINELSTSNKGRGDLSLRLMNKRWPKVEVDALIQIRSSLEKKFQGPGYKGPLWDEISSLMASMGFQRTAKRCKEKWENINKYFKKSRENSNSKQTRKKLKTCQYFDQLDQLYSKSSGVVINGSNSCSSSSEHQANPNTGNGLLPKQNEVFGPAVNFREAEFRVPTIDFNGGSMNGNLEELNQGSIIKRIDEHHLELDHRVGDMREEVEEGDDNGNNVQK